MLHTASCLPSGERFRVEEIGTRVYCLQLVGNLIAGGTEEALSKPTPKERGNDGYGREKEDLQ